MLKALVKCSFSDIQKQRLSNTVVNTEYRRLLTLKTDADIQKLADDHSLVLLDSK